MGLPQTDKMASIYRIEPPGSSMIQALEKQVYTDSSETITHGYHNQRAHIKAPYINKLKV